MATYDVVVVGGGTNGLTVAAYLQKAGLNTCVCEYQNFVGGGARTQEVTLPGFKHDTASGLHVGISSNPLLLNDELQLKSKYGLKYCTPETISSVAFHDGTEITVYKDVDKTCQSIAQHSQKDADAYRKFVEYARPMIQMIVPGSFSPPTPFGSLFAVLDSSDEGREMMRMLLMSAWDVVSEWFEDERTKALLSRWASEALVGPQEAGTGVVIPLMIGGLHSIGMPFPIGGSQQLAHALESCLKDMGATIKTSAAVKHITVVGGVAKGVVLESGEEIVARKAVITTVHVKALFEGAELPCQGVIPFASRPALVGKQHLPESFPNKVNRLRYSQFSAFHQGLALDQAPKYKAGDAVSNCCNVTISPMGYEFLADFDNLKNGIPVTDAPACSCFTLHDPTRAPAGKHTLYLFHHAPFKLKDGGPGKWDEIKEDVSEKIIETFLSATTNLSRSNVLGKWSASPLDLWRSNPTWIAGDFHQLSQSLDQIMANRPIPGWGRYKTPIQKLYMGGGSCHPGPGITGGGRAVAQVVFEDLGIDFEKVIS